MLSHDRSISIIISISSLPMMLLNPEKRAVECSECTVQLASGGWVSQGRKLTRVELVA